jgi:transposase-like protein
MTRRVGRKPLSTRHVDHLSGSARAKDRLRVILETLRGTITIPDACRLLDVGEAQFHHLRHQWLQQALELLEPRAMGRPPKREDPRELASERARLESEVNALRDQVHGAQVREEIAQILADPAREPGKKTEGRTPVLPKPR